MESTPVHIFDAIAKDRFKATEDSDGEIIDGPRSKQTEMMIYLFGSTVEGTPVRIEVNGFHPFFWLGVPAKMESKGKLMEYVAAVEAELVRALPEGTEITVRAEDKKLLYGFTGGKTYKMVRVEVPSINAFYTVRRAVLDEYQKPKLKLYGELVRVYEANLDPMLRFFHLRDIQPCGWIMSDEYEEGTFENGALLWSCTWDSISPVAKPPAATAPLLLASWDIECYSGTGDFPMAQGSWRRIAKELYNAGVKASEAPLILAELLTGTCGLNCAVVGIKESAIPELRCRRKPTYDEICLTLADEERKGALAEVLTGDRSLVGKDKEERLEAIQQVLRSALGRLTPLAGDPIIQIGIVLVRRGGGGGDETERHIFTLGGCTPVEGVVVHSFSSERDMLIAWGQWMTEKNPDILVGYNIFGFDEKYVWDRMVELGLVKTEKKAGGGRRGGGETVVVHSAFEEWTRMHENGGVFKLERKFLSSSALGDNYLNYWSTSGRLQVDLYHHIRRKQALPSYKLDAVCATYLSGKLQGLERRIEDGAWILFTKQKGDARVGRSVMVLDELGEALSGKLEILEIVKEGLVVRAADGDDGGIEGSLEDAVKWAVVKDDVSPQEIFKLQRGSDEDRARVAAYCIQDCELVVELYKKLDVFNEAMSMANVCSVPVSYIFTRGQGVKIESLIFKDCYARNQLIEVLPAARFGGGEDAGEDDGAATQEDSYEGAIVLDPTPGMYFDAPVGVCDFASLYPSTIISENISHDSIVWVKDYNLAGGFVEANYMSPWGEAELPEGWRYTDISFDILRPDPNDHRKHKELVKQGTRVCRYAQPPGDTKTTLPDIVAKLLAARKAKRKEAEKEDDPFRKALLDAEQLAYKLTANSLYGQLGSGTFKIRMQNLAASVTAYGRLQIMCAKEAIEQFYGSKGGYTNPEYDAKIVYGDTDSLFVCFNPRDPVSGARLEGRDAIVRTIELTEEAGKLVTSCLKAPHDFEYDKVFYPFIIFSKKRYVGNKYEESPDDFKQTSMGIVLKRRDNAPILKVIYGGAVDLLLNKKDIVGATRFVQNACRELVDGKTKLSLLTISSSLRAEYNTPSLPKHKVLADRIALRDPGNAPAAGDRIDYVYVAPPTGQLAAKLQGDRIETPAFVRANGLRPDVQFYIEHQLMNPLSQLFALEVEKMPGYTEPKGGWNENPDKRAAQREILASDILFHESLDLCGRAATRTFMNTMFGGAATAGPLGPTESSKRVAGAAARKKKVEPPKIQSDITSYFGDARLAREMRAVKRAVRTAAATEKKE
jgi:DNA polymerase elongation subunit (family B)